jgi:hypothetical protein
MLTIDAQFPAVLGPRTKKRGQRLRQEAWERGKRCKKASRKPFVGTLRVTNPVW